MGIWTRLKGKGTQPLGNQEVQSESEVGGWLIGLRLSNRQPNQLQIQ